MKVGVGGYDMKTYLLQSKVNPKVKILTVPGGSEAGRDYEVKYYDAVPKRGTTDTGFFSVLAVGEDSDVGNKKAGKVCGVEDVIVQMLVVKM